MLRKSLLTVAVASLTLGALPLSVPAHAAATVKTGILTCHVGSGYSFVFGSSRHLNCTYQSDANALLGGSNREIELQPFSVGDEKGLNVAAGIASITLRARR
ncbi:MAG: DUF992 domain-containing protein [Acetobacteraceae bacterium]